MIFVSIKNDLLENFGANFISIAHLNWSYDLHCQQIPLPGTPPPEKYSSDYDLTYMDF